MVINILIDRYVAEPIPAKILCCFFCFETMYQEYFSRCMPRLPESDYPINSTANYVIAHTVKNRLPRGVPLINKSRNGQIVLYRCGGSRSSTLLSKR